MYIFKGCYTVLFFRLMAADLRNSVPYIHGLAVAWVSVYGNCHTPRRLSMFYASLGCWKWMETVSMVKGIAVMSYEHHVISLTLCLDLYKKCINALYYWPFMCRTHQWPVNYQHQGPMIRKTFPCQYAIMPSKLTTVLLNTDDDSKYEEW